SGQSHGGQLLGAVQAVVNPQSPLPLLWQDEHLVVVNKPSGLAEHQGWAREPHTVVSVLRDQLGEHSSPIHRLDRATSSALVLAREPATIRPVQAQFDAGTIVKNYLALVWGNTTECGLIGHAIAKSK